MRTTLIAASLLATAACGSFDDPANSDDYTVVDEGKEDSFRSPAALEYLAKADATVTLAEADRSLTDAQRLDKAKEIVSAKLLQIGWFLNLYVADKEPEDANKSYGGYHAMARNSSVKSLSVTAVDALTFRFNFEATIAGQNSFLTVLPGTSATGGKKFDLKMGKLTNDELVAGTWQGRYDVHTWNPTTAEATTVESLPVTVTKAPRSQNAYLDYGRLYADGKLEVGAQFGWDYNAGRADLANAEQLFDELVGLGFASPTGVTAFKDLKLDSGPLTRKGIYNGKPVDISVKLVHPGMVANPTTDGAKLREALVSMLATKEVILFNGHAGVSGRLLTADFRSNSLGTIAPTEYPTLALKDGYQIFLVEGCQTYARFTDGFRMNPKKRGPSGELKDMDIVTSTSYTWTSQGAESMEQILFPLVGNDAGKNIKPVTWDDVLRTMNQAPNTTAFMGVNGIDNDPHGHPYARADKLGTSCSAATTCGGEGNLCVKKSTSSTAKVCASVCIDDAGCPTAYRCAAVATTGTLSGRACVAR
ncbi:hypothetical protein BH11MYX3_BH11MYX3_26770 [soil metagenome]